MNENHFLISVIIPCYNVELYIEECLNSIVQQTFGVDNLEIILINDASTDNTLSVLYEWENKYPDNIILINCTENHRQGAARNLGMQYASGDYIAFIDSDDVADITLLEKLYSKSIMYNCDIVECAYTEFYTGSSPSSQILFKDFYWEFDTDTKRKDFIIYSQKVSVFGRLYKADFLKENHLLFLEDIGYEDIHFSGLTMLMAKNYYAVGEILYFYRQNDTGTMLSPNNHALDWRLCIIDSFMQEIKERGLVSDTLTPYKEELEFYIVTKGFLDAILTAVQTNLISSAVLADYIHHLLTRFPSCTKNHYLNQLNPSIWEEIKAIILNKKYESP